MSSCAEHPVTRLSNAGIAHACGRHTEQFWQGQTFDPCFCYELWQRALAQPLQPESKQAWAFVHHQYLRQATIWVKRHPLFPQTGQEPDDLAALALEKMWLAFSHAPQKFSQFPVDDAGQCLKSLLRFLKMCVHSVVVDTLASGEQGISLEEDTVEFFADPPLQPENLAAFWRCIYERLNHEDERLVVDAMFVYDLKPRQIQAHYPDRFPSVQQIYRIKENVLARFRRDEALRDCLED